MHTSLTREQRDFQRAIRDFCAAECGTREQRDALTHNGETNHSDPLYRKMAGLGWIGVGIPEEYGGGGGGSVEECLLLEETMRAGAPIFSVNTTIIVGGIFKRFGSEDQKQRVLGGITRGDVHAVAMSEPDSGSDVGSMICKAVPDGDSYRINGQKTWCSNAQNAAQILLVAREDNTGNKHQGLTMLEIPADLPNVEKRGIPTMMGKDDVNDVFFTDAVVPASAVVGQPRKAWMQLMAGLNGERLLAGASALGLAWRAFDMALAYVKERKQFGQMIGSFQAVRHTLAGIAAELEATQSMIYDLARAVDAEPDRLFAREASMVKLKACNLARSVSIESMHFHGGNGYTLEYDIESLVRTAIIMPVPGGSREVQLDIIASTYGL